MIKLLFCVLAIAAASNGAKVLWQQYVEKAIYDDVGVSKLGYVGASTWLNEPEVAEFFLLHNGNKTIKKVDDSNPNDGASFQMAMSEFSTRAIVGRSLDGQWNSKLYMFDLKSNSSSPVWTSTLKDAELIGQSSALSISDDGSLVAAAVVSNLSYYEPPVEQLIFFDGNTGSEHIDFRYQCARGDSISSVQLSGDGQYALFTRVVAKTKTVEVHVLHFKSGGHHVSPDTSFKQKEEYVFPTALSVDGKYYLTVQEGKINFYKRNASQTQSLEYTYYLSAAIPANFFASADSVAFSASGDVAVVGLIDGNDPSVLVPTILAFDLRTKSRILNYVYPKGSGEYQNTISGVAVSESGKYIGVATWGTQNRDPGTEQIQVFTSGNSTAPSFKMMTPGSMMSIGLTESSNGHRLIVVAAGKHVHANQMGYGGDLYCIDAFPYTQMTLDTDPIIDESIINAINSNPSSTWKAGVNDRLRYWTIAEAKAMMGTHVLPSARSKSSLKTQQAVRAKRAAQAIPASFDARQTWPQCVGPVRNQAQCGSCWAFGAAESFGDRVCIANQGSKPVVLSPEMLVDCDAQNDGCGGGWLLYAWQFIANPGIVSDECYPYTASTGQAGACRHQCVSTNSSFTRYRADVKTIEELQGVEAMQTAIMTHGPIEAAFTVYSDFMQYVSGVYSHTTGIYLGGHAIRVLGWGTTTDNVDYWIIANSWGDTWGDKGYFLMKRGVNECELEVSAITAQVA